MLPPIRAEGSVRPATVAADASAIRWHRDPQVFSQRRQLAAAAGLIGTQAREVRGRKTHPHRHLALAVAGIVATSAMWPRAAAIIESRLRKACPTECE